MMMEQGGKIRTRRKLKVLWPTIAVQIFGFLFALIVAGVPGHANAADPRDKNPPEVKALIGMRIFSDNPATPHGDIPGFHQVNGSVIAEITDQSMPYSLLLKEGFLNSTPVFLICKKNKGATAIEVLDAQAIPPELYEYRLNLKKKDSPPVDYLLGRYRLSEYGCSYGDTSKDQIIIGLVKPEVGKKDCGHYSRQVGRAWKIDSKTGRIGKMSTAKLQCYYLTMGNCE
jgi:hypothetical protein